MEKYTEQLENISMKFHQKMITIQKNYFLSLNLFVILMKLWILLQLIRDLSEIY